MISFANHTVGVLILLCFPSFVPAQSSAIDGDWQGTLGGTGLTMLFHVKVGGKSTVDSPRQHIYGLLTEVTVDGKIVSISMLSAGMTFAGTLQGLQIKGTYTQTGSSYPLTLTRIGISKPKPNQARNAPRGPEEKGARISARDLDGDWQGTLETSKFSMVFHIKLAGKSTVDSPDNHVFGYLISVAVAGSVVKIAMPAAGMELQGKLQGATIKGTYSQLGSDWPITLTRMDHAGASPPEIRARDVDGDWEGRLQEINYPMVFHITLNGKSSVDNPSQHIFGYLINVRVEGRILRIEMPAAGMKFEGTPQGSKIKGTYSQLGSSWPLTLTRKEAPGSTSK